MLITKAQVWTSGISFPQSATNINLHKHKTTHFDIGNNSNLYVTYLSKKNKTKKLTSYLLRSAQNTYLVKIEGCHSKVVANNSL